jgi:hypothetical protein
LADEKLQPTPPDRTDNRGINLLAHRSNRAQICAIAMRSNFPESDPEDAEQEHRSARLPALSLPRLHRLVAPNPSELNGNRSSGK